MANLILSLKTALISTGIISLAILLKVSAPSVTEFVTTAIPSIYSLVLSFLRPPYLYLVINCIIISIVASSKLQSQKLESTRLDPSPEAEIISTAVKVSSEVFRNEFGYGTSSETERVVNVVAEDLSKRTVAEEQVKVVNKAVAPLRSESMELISLLDQKSADKPPVAKRFSQRKAVKAAAEGKALRVSKPKRQDTLESTWKAITEGRSMPLTRHLKKSDTWELRNQKDHNAPPPPLPNTMKKSDTFNERSKESSLTRSSGSGKLKRDPSLSQDELNRRVEAFINKFNEEMRLQRQESENQFQEMLKRGAQ